MSLTTTTTPATSPIVVALPKSRWMCLGALILAEVMATTLLFDMGSLHGQGPGVWVLNQAHHLPRVVLAAVLATVVLGGARLLNELREVAGQVHDSERLWAYLLGHLLALTAFTALTATLLSGGDHPAIEPGWLVVAWVATGSATLALWGAAMLPPELWPRLARRLAGPLLAGLGVGVGAWAAGRLTARFWEPLSFSTFQVVRFLLGLGTSEIVCRPADYVIGTPAFRVQIAPECSGYEGIGLIWALLGAYLWLGRRTLRFPQAWLLLPMGTAAIWLANAVRIALLIAVGAWGSRAVAQGGFHSQAGWIAFNAVGLGLITLAQRSRFFTLGDVNRADFPPLNFTAAYLAPMLAIVAMAMLSGAMTNGFDWLYPLRIPAAVAALWLFRRHDTELRLVGSWQAVAIGVIAFVMWMGLEPLSSGSSGGDALADGLARLPRSLAIAWLACRVVGSVALVPLAEELAFRGYVIRRLSAVDFRSVPLDRFAPLPFLVSSILFGVLHGRWLAGTLAGMLYAVAVYRRGRLSDAVVAHATTNALIAAYVLATGSWWLWT